MIKCNTASEQLTLAAFMEKRFLREILDLLVLETLRSRKRYAVALH